MQKHLIIVLLLFLTACSRQPASSDAAPGGTAASETAAAETAATETVTAETEKTEDAQNTTAPEAETTVDPYTLTAEELLSDMEKYQKGNLVFYVPKALGMHTDEEADVPENQFFLTCDYMGMIVGQVGEHDDLAKGGVAETMLNDQKGLVAALTPPGEIEAIDGRYYSYGITESEDINFIDTWTVIPDRNCLYLIEIRSAEEDWDLFHEVIAGMISKMEVTGSN
ncbi:MAG: hypothetical protein IJI52_05835 [Solobacterium sp.]|nr:hypothetical protein [Solobacterium sp.]